METNSTQTKCSQDNKVIKWIKVPDLTSTKIEWKPIFIIRSSAPNRSDCEYFIGKSTDNQYRTYHLDELHDLPASQYSNKQMANIFHQSLHDLFTQTTINEADETPLYLYHKPSDSRSFLSRFNIFNSNKNGLSLDLIHDCEFHESAAIDESDRNITGLWIKTEQQTEKLYMSIDKIKSIHYIDDVNPVEYKKNDDWVVVHRNLKCEHESDVCAIQQLKDEMDQLKAQNIKLKYELRRSHNTNLSKYTKIIAEQKRHLKDKQKEIDRLRGELIARSNAKELHSKFPTIEEVCAQYQSLKNQEFQGVHSKLTKPLRKKHRDWNKGYINKLSHKLLFETLCKCYQYTLEYHDDIYREIGIILHIEHDDAGNETLQFLFHRYLTNNFETMRKSKRFADIIDKIRIKICKEYEDTINILSDEEQEALMNVLKVFVNKCCDICWCMVLIRPMLTLSPYAFIPKDKIVFDEEKQKRMLGSSKKDKYVLYVAWPAIAQNNIQLDNMKIYVVQRDTPFMIT